MPRMVRFHKIGGPEVLQIEEIDVQPPASGEVRIKVKALGLNRAEVMYRTGKYLEEAKLPSRLGYEAAGIIEAVGPGVTGFAIGDHVSIVPHHSQNQYGVYGEIATVPAYYVVKHPSNISFIEAAAAWMQYMTAYGALFDIAAIKKGDYVVITASSSSVGLAAIQLCNYAGAIPIATTRTSEKRKALLEAGAAHVIAMDEQNFPEKIHAITGGKGARIIFDSVAGKGVSVLADGIAMGGILFVYGALAAEPTPFPLMKALAKGLTMRGYTLFEFVADPVRFEKGKRFILDALASGKLKPVIDKTFPLEEIVEAHRYMESNKQFGKIVVTVND